MGITNQSKKMQNLKRISAALVAASMGSITQSGLAGSIDKQPQTLNTRDLVEQLLQDGSLIQKPDGTFEINKSRQYHFEKSNRDTGEIDRSLILETLQLRLSPDYFEKLLQDRKIFNEELKAMSFNGPS